MKQQIFITIKDLLNLAYKFNSDHHLNSSNYINFSKILIYYHHLNSNNKPPKKDQISKIKEISQKPRINLTPKLKLPTLITKILII